MKIHKIIVAALVAGLASSAMAEDAGEALARANSAFLQVQEAQSRVQSAEKQAVAMDPSEVEAMLSALEESMGGYGETPNYTVSWGPWAEEWHASPEGYYVIEKTSQEMVLPEEFFKEEAVQPKK